ncbi:MAG TPA: phosphoribosylanthranilate isomerase [Gemmatimonadaceae bacterium]|nr:phosphoribosylanthranilate isomerase [Gemmatimonadaceae bacterium]
MVEIKFCGMMRSEDADAAASLGARYVGVVFAESPRQVSDERAREVFARVPLGISRVGVFGDTKPEQIAARADALGLDVVQLHGDPKPRMIARVRKKWHGRVWAVQRISDTLPDSARDLFEVSDGVVLDARTPDQLGGTGVTLPWEDLQERVDLFRPPRAKLVLAGGLTPENVARAIGVLRPDVVDVSSGVELMVGVKDHDRMRAFRDAVAGAEVR